MDARHTIGRLAGHGAPERRVVRDYGRDSLLVWANLLLAPLFGLLGIRVGLQSEERLAARIASDTAAMRKKGYLVASVERFSLPVMGAPGTTASWYRVTYELAAQPGDVTGHDPGA
jgi:hypothetical protein